MKKGPKVTILVVAGLILLMFAVGNWQRPLLRTMARNWSEMSEGADLADDLRKPEDVLEYIASHPDTASLAAWIIGQEADGIYHRADVPRPLASTASVLALAEYAAQVAEAKVGPDERVDLPAWEAHVLPGTDSGAHATVMNVLGRAGKPATAPLLLVDVVEAMIRYSDHAATDYLLHRLGRERTDSAPARLGMANGEPPRPTAGGLLAWRSREVTAPVAEVIAGYQTAGRERFADEAWRMSARLKNDAGFAAAERAALKSRAHELRMREQAELARALDTRGTARDYAGLMARLWTGELPGTKTMRTHLEWPMSSPQVRQRFESVGTKSGGFPGVMTAVYFAKPRDKAPRVLALFLQDIPTAAWIEMMRTFVQQSFEFKMLTEDPFFEQVKKRLAEPG